MMAFNAIWMVTLLQVRQMPTTMKTLAISILKAVP